MEKLVSFEYLKRFPNPVCNWLSDLFLISHEINGLKGKGQPTRAIAQ